MALVGFLGGSTISADGVEVRCDSFGLNFAAITVVALDEKPLSDAGRLLVTLAARAENEGAQWNATRTSVGNVWGKGGAPIAERVPADVRLPINGARKVFALNPDGSVAAEIPATFAEGVLQFSTRAGPPTLHYEVR
jgi:hypothetical protein